MINIKKFLVLLCAIVLTANAVQAIQDVKKANNEPLQEYTNEIHSVFSLKDCIKIAIDNNPEIRASIYNEEAYKSKIGQAWANYFPSLSAGVEASRSGNKYSHTHNYPTGRRSVYSTMTYVPNISANMLLFDFGKTKASADMAKSLYEATKEDTKENINTIVYDIKTTYYNILFAQAQVKVYEDTVKDYELQLSRAWGFYKLGKKAKVDVVTAEYNLGKAQLNLIKAKNVLEVAQVQLSKIMGVPEYTNYELSDELSLYKCNITVEEAIKTAFETRPELLSVSKSVKAAKLNLRAARREYTPNLGIFGSYGNGLGNEYDLRSAQVGVGLNYNGLNIVRTKKQINQARAEYKKVQAQYDAVKDNVYLNVKQNYIDLTTAKEAILIAKLALDQAKEQYRQVSGRYKAGIGDAIELKDGENTYLNARLDFYNAMLNYNVTAAGLEKEIGAPLVFSEEYILEIKPEDI